MDEKKLNEFIERYVGMWHESDAAKRRIIVEQLFAEDAENYTSKYVVRGLSEIIRRVTRAHEEWVASKGFVFRPAGNNRSAHHHLIKFSWEMLPKAGGPLEARGVDVFVLREDARIGALYQFPEPLSGYERP